MTELARLQDAVLPSGIRSRFGHDINGLRMHVLEAGFEDRGRPLVLLLHDRARLFLAKDHVAARRRGVPCRGA